MPKYEVYATTIGGKYIGTFEADSKEEAIEEAQESDAAWVHLCHQCAGECEDAELTNWTAVGTGE